MNLLLIHAIFVVCCFPVGIRACDVETTEPCVHFLGDESGVMIHGTILRIRDDQVVAIPLGSREPIRFTHGEGTVYVDESGNPLTLKLVRSGFAVSIFYTQAGEHRIANRVIVGEPGPYGSLERLAKKASR